MKDKLISYLTFGNHFYSVEQTQQNGEPLYYGITLKKKKNQVEVEHSFQFNNLTESTKYIPKNKPVFLIINNENIITKKIENSELDTLKLTHLAFPNIKIEDFYYEILKQENVHYIAICRKTYLDELLNDYRSHHISIIDFSLGNLMIASLVHLISEDKIHTSNAIISKENNQIVNILADHSSNKTTYNFNNTSLNTTELLNFSSALSLITKTKAIESLFGDIQNDLQRDFKEKTFFIQFIKIGLSALFAALLINFFVFNNYYEKVNTLKETTQVLNTSKNKVIRLNENVQKIQKVVEDVLKSNASKSSFYANELISSLPESIILSKLNYQPLLKKIKANKSIINDTNIIIISGASSERVVVSEWISQLEIKHWIHKIEIINFEDTTTSSSLFSFKIYIENETKN
ncbi:hypothetical protein A9Q86_00055 [Flavobacteriales bacterium 33_180_T64]|nr:hypothetical protein A9Q86_00055 [Flavobacteriales bacterium 33_180_T64]